MACKTIVFSDQSHSFYTPKAKLLQPKKVFFDYLSKIKFYKLLIFKGAKFLHFSALGSVCCALFDLLAFAFCEQLRFSYLFAIIVKPCFDETLGRCNDMKVMKARSTAYLPVCSQCLSGVFICLIWWGNISFLRGNLCDIYLLVCLIFRIFAKKINGITRASVIRLAG